MASSLQSSSTTCSNNIDRFTFWMQNTSSSSTDSSSSIFAATKKSADATANWIEWMIENRSGIAILTGSLLVPSQFSQETHQEFRDHIIACSPNNTEFIYFEPKSSKDRITGVICYPKNWKTTDTSRCVLYHNPNGAVIANFYDRNGLTWTPKEIMDIEQCPIIMYDYKGTGLNKGASSSSGLSASGPTYASIVNDGDGALKYALKNFKAVSIWGSSLGGGVATASLDRRLHKNSSLKERVTLTNHDSFTTTPRVVMPSNHLFADTFGSLIGANLDAETPMRSIIE